MIDRFERDAGELGVDLRGGQPAPGNIAGGLTTIEEKSLGAAKKGGSAPIQSVLEYAEAPRAAGLHVMDTPGNDIEQMVGMVAAGCKVVAFTTGRGTPTGSPIAPCIKIATNSRALPPPGRRPRRQRRLRPRRGRVAGRGRRAHLRRRSSPPRRAG